MRIRIASAFLVASATALLLTACSASSSLTISDTAAAPSPTGMWSAEAGGDSATESLGPDMTEGDSLGGEESGGDTMTDSANETVEQSNARQMAQDYLDYSAFSRKGLIDQLKFEGFSTADATYGVDSLDADWNEQAALMAQQYLDNSAFSRSGLIDQLVYEGFSKSQATYGADAAGDGPAAGQSADEGSVGDTTTDSGSESLEQGNARQMAQDYLDYSAFSRKGLIDQLKFEGFSTADATYGVDSLDADWNEQAALMAQQYLENSAFSRSGLIDQLVYEGFSKSQATYGVDAAGM